MEPFSVRILGCGSALPTLRHNPSAQVVSLRGKHFLLDCGEGTQLQYRRARLPFGGLQAVFISHAHGDHCFGLMGLISTFSMLGRTAPLHVYGPPQLEAWLQPQLRFYADSIGFDVCLHTIDPEVSDVIYEDRSLTVSTLPLRHRLPCCGFLFREHPGLPHIRRDMIDRHAIPHHAINSIKQGAAWELPDGTVIPHEQLTTPAEPARSYAYCSDTAPSDTLPPLIRGVSLLYHEATYAQSEAARAAEVMHSTARQAAQVALKAAAGRLVIGHFSSRYDDEAQLLAEAREVFPRTSLANEGMVFSV